MVLTGHLVPHLFVRITQNDTRLGGTGVNVAEGMIELLP